MLDHLLRLIGIGGTNIEPVPRTMSEEPKTDPDIRDRLSGFIDEQERREREWKRERREWRDRIAEPGKNFRSDEHVVTCPPRRYADWLRRHMEQGFEPTHWYDYPSTRCLVMARHSFELPPLYGARSVNMLVPAGVSVGISGGLGHNSVFWEETGLRSGSFVPVYSDIAELLGRIANPPPS